MIRIETIIEKLRENHPSVDEELLRRAYLFSARQHRGQTRQSGEPYLVHPLEVANILADLNLDPICVTTGLLHDIVEDTETSVEEIEEYFGPEIAHLVDGLTKISRLDQASTEERQALNMRKMLLAMVDDVRVVLVKLADRLHNMRTLEYLPGEKRRRIAQETLDVYAPIAHRLGMARVRGELEDLAFKHLEPEEYQKLKELVESRRSRLDAFLDDARAIHDDQKPRDRLLADIRRAGSGYPGLAERHPKMAPTLLGSSALARFALRRLLIACAARRACSSRWERPCRRSAARTSGYEFVRKFASGLRCAGR